MFTGTFKISIDILTKPIGRKELFRTYSFVKQNLNNNYKELKNIKKIIKKLTFLQIRLMKYLQKKRYHLEEILRYFTT